MLIILFVLLFHLTTSQLWSEFEIFTIKNPFTHPYCWQQCSSIGMGMKSGNRCKCVKTELNCDEKCCKNFCEETDRLEGSAYDNCNSIDNNICAMYKITI